MLGYLSERCPAQSLAPCTTGKRWQQVQVFLWCVSLSGHHCVQCADVRVMPVAQIACSEPRHLNKRFMSTLLKKSWTVRSRVWHGSYCGVLLLLLLLWLLLWCWVCLHSVLCADVLAGYHGCLLAYGQTGAGKTHTMAGPSFDDPVMRVCAWSVWLAYHQGCRDVCDPGCTLQGIIPRVVDRIFQHARNADDWYARSQQHCVCSCLHSGEGEL